MFIVMLKFSENRAKADAFVQGHKNWIQQGFEDGVFLVVGSLLTDQGGAIIAHNTDLKDIKARVADDPFVTEGIVTAEILEISPARTDARLDFIAA